MRDLYGTHFEQNLYTLYIDQFPLNSSDFHDIRYALNLVEPKYRDIPIINRGISFLETYIHCFKDIVVPNMSKPDHISHFKRITSPLKEEMQIKMKMAAYILPININRMIELIHELKEQLPPVPQYYRNVRHQFIK